ncbi:MAG TPA: sulfatase-like hydrolase/transferase, partial [Polyangiales bacterium]
LHMPRPWQRVPRVVRSAAEAVVSIAALVILLWQINYGLRQYNFLARFVLPSTWLVAGSLLYAALCRLPPLARGVCIAAAAAGLALLCPGGAHAVKRAQTVFVRTGAVAGLTDLAIGTHHPPAFANIDVSHPKHFDCAAEPPARSTTLRYDTPAALRRNVILISVDALRKDTVDALRDGRPAMPELLAFAKQSLVFERAVTSYPATLFALGSALTGQSPSEVLFAPKVPDNLFTLGRQRFSQQLVSLPQSRWFTKSIVSRLFTQGAQTLLGPDAREQTRSLIARLEQARKSGASVLGWIHYYETHESLERAAHSSVDPVPVYLRDASEIDAQIGRLVKYLRESGYLNDSLVLVFADHGEALGERRHFGHHVYLNRWIIDVPMLLHAPSVAPGKSEALVTIADIAPTVLHWAGLPVPVSEARSLLPAAEPSHAVAERFAVSEAFPVRGAALFDLARTPIGSVQALLDRVGLVQQSAEEYLPKVSVVSSRYRLIVNRVTGAEELYDRDHDPAESHDLADDGRPVQARMRAALAQWTKTLSSRIYCRVARVAQH